ncbi:MAG TPA: TldD/PmbA family protein [Candidatus Nanoarchaeia archaeon]|nr:TldD/PmbA family protein [Candidatus Nanoarchaeia archaeon]
MDEDLVHFAIDFLEKQGCSYVEARLEESEGNDFILKNGTLDLASYSQITGLGVRFLLKNKLNFVSTNELARDHVLKKLQAALHTAKKAAKYGEHTELSREESHEDRYTVKAQIDPQNLEPEAKIRWLKELDQDLLATSVKLPSRYLQYGDSQVTEYLATSEGIRITQTLPKVHFFYNYLIQAGNETSQKFCEYGATQGWEGVLGWKLNQTLPEQVKALHKNVTEGKAAPKEAVDLVVSPEVTGIMVHESVGHPYEADRILGREAAQAGESFISQDMVGSRIGNDCVTVCDDPTLENGFGHYKYDNEGVRARRKYLIKKGMIHEFLHNRETAAQMNHGKSNGSSRATDYDKESIIRMSNTIVLPGEFKTEEELIADVKLGVWMKNYMEWNIDDKRLNARYTGAEAYLIKNGKIAGPVRNPTLEITTPKLWGSVDGVAQNSAYFAGNCGKGEPMQGIPVWFGGPSMRLRKIKFRT